MRLVGVSILVVLGLGGCDIPPEQERRDVCTAFCDCLGGLPSQVESCITDDCLPDVPPTISDSCRQCVYENSQMCSVLFNDCLGPCFGITP